MSYSPKDQYRNVEFFSADDFAGLKELVNSECVRRRGEGSVQTYSGTDYQFKVNPAKGALVQIEHGTMLYEPLAAIDPTGLVEPKSGEVVMLDEIAAKVVALSSIEETSSDSGCLASCTGLCTTGCYTTCTGGCTGSCTGCTGSCTGSCSGCSGTCSGTCTGCTATCSSGCGGDCVSCAGYGCGVACQQVNCSASCVGSSA